MLPTRVWGIAAFTLSVHALLLAAAWRVPPVRRPSQPVAITLRLVPGAALRQGVAAAPTSAPTPTTVPKPASMQRAQRVRPDVPVPLRPEPAQAEVPVASPVREAGAAETINGVAFGMPRIGLPGASTSRWTNPPAAHDAAPASTPAMMLAPSSRERAMREAARTQIADAAQRTLADTPIASAGAADGRCLLTIEADARLVCDDVLLAQALAPREAALSGLLQAYRSVEPSAGALAVTLVQGRYQLSWDVHSEGDRPPLKARP